MATTYLFNPRKRRSAKRGPKTTARRPKRRSVFALPRKTKRRRNPAPRAPRVLGPYRGKTIVRDIAIPAGTAAAGALLLDVAWNNLPIPDVAKSGPAQYLAKGLGAIAIGMVAQRVTNKQTASALTMGALTVVTYQLMRQATQRFAPQVNIGMMMPARMGYMQSAVNAGSYRPALPDASSDLGMMMAPSLRDYQNVVY